MPLSDAEYLQLRQLYQFRCGYCGVSEIDTGAELTVDHFRPRSHQGPDILENCVYCCHACNSFKGAYWNPDEARRILHPFHDNLAEHVAMLPDQLLSGLTETGRFHIQRLHLNRAALIAHRLDEHLRQEEQRRIARVEAALEQVQEQLNLLLSRLPSELQPEGEND